VGQTAGGTAAGQDPAATGTGTPGATGDPKPGAGTINTGKTVEGTGSTPPAAAGTGGAPQEGEPRVYTPEYVAELRREAAKHRVAAQETATKLKAFEDAQLTEEQKKDKRFKELEEENIVLRSEHRKSSALAEAAKLGAVVPEAIAGLIPADAENIGSAVAAIKKQFPALFKTPAPSGTADAGAGTGGQGGNTGAGGQAPHRSMNSFLRVASGRQV